MSNTCGCIRCYSDLASKTPTTNMFSLHFRYACEKCGNKRCPHHSDHRLEFTRSNNQGKQGAFCND
jgi:hypothetical protein